MGRSPKKESAVSGKNKDSTVEPPNGSENNKSKKGSPKKVAPTVIKLKIPDNKPAADAEKKPLRLTLKISKTEDQVVKEAEPVSRITPKLTLSLRRPSVETATPATEASLPKKRGRKPNLLKAASVESTKSDDSKSSLTGGKKKLVASAPASFGASKSSLGSASAASLTPPAKPVVPVYSEEDRIQRQIINEIIQEKVSRLQGHHALWNKPVESIDQLIANLWPFYEQLAVTEITHSLVYRQAGAKGSPSATSEVASKQEAEYESLLGKFNQLTTLERTKTAITELVLLEHRLCLEEEKFLYTKLKNDYYTNYANMGGKGSSSSAPR